MFNFGESLYRLTRRDEQTLLVDPFFRDSGTVSLNIGVANLTYNYSVPVDRALYLHDVIIALEPTVGTTWQFVSVTVADAAGRVGTVGTRRSATGLVSDNDTAAGGIGKGVMITIPARLVLPPQINQLQINVSRDTSAAIATIVAKVSGYIIPPGGIGRNSYGIG